MKTIFFYTIATLLFYCNGSAQLNGSGKIITRNYDFRNYDKLEIKDLNGKITIETGATWSINVAIDDNLLPLLKFTENKSDYLLAISLDNNENNKLYIENTNIRIRITMPEASYVSNNGNSIIELSNLNGRYFKLANTSNGKVTLGGSIDNLEIINSGNANVMAAGLSARSAQVTSTGNGDVILNCNGTIEASLSGNGDVVNKGSGRFSRISMATGNGKFLNKSK